MVPPTHTLRLPVMTALGAATIVTFRVAVEIQPALAVTVTKYAPATGGALMAAVVAANPPVPVQLATPVVVAVSKTLALEQTLVAPVTFAVVGALTVMERLADPYTHRHW